MSEAEQTQEQVPILTQIQNELHAPKNQYNSFGKYKYRNAEDIEQAVKPILLKYNSSLRITDEPVLIGDWHYIKSTAVLKVPDEPDPISITAYAREELKKKGQDTSQTTGSTSSYARKYALGGLFLIDDTKDADSQAPASAQARPARNRPTRKVEKGLATNSKTAREDEKLMDWTVNYLNTDTKLVKIVQDMTNGDLGAKKYLTDLAGDDKVAAREIYKRRLFLGA